jgi:cell division protein FtsI (penicillin-binding protein 3)
VTAVAAVEQQVVDFQQVFETPENGEVVIHGLTLRDHDPLGDITFEEVMRQSSNVATAEIAMRLKNETFYQYARNLGFGTPTYVDIAGEESGRMAKPYEWSMVSLPWMSHGYELLATPLQVTQAYAAFANEGKLMRPYIVDRIEDKKGNLIRVHEPTEIRRVAKKGTLEKLLPIFESVVSDSGTGEFAQVDGIRIAGKTGTAKKVVNGRYTNRYRGSFVGFFPVEDPSYVAYILLDEPKPVGYGGYTAGPVFRQVATRILGLDNELMQQVSQREENDERIVVPNLRGLTRKQASRITDELDLRVAFNGEGGIVMEQLPASGDTLYKTGEITLDLSNTGEAVAEATDALSLVTLPDLRGMNMRQAVHLLHSMGLQADINGSGTIYAQFPLQGADMRPGRTVTLRGKARSLETLTQSGTDK